MDSTPPLEHLSPPSVWRHFATLCRIPRPSGHEGAIRDTLAAWARLRGLPTRIDTTGNLVIRKPATPGREDRPILVLQGHLDMVCQKRKDSPHDFLSDPIRPVVRHGWVVAEETTLGADNGIGVALALAALESTDLAHGPLEVLLTLDEESGMTGAWGLEADALAGRLMINLDTEEWGRVYVGCAGGVDVLVGHDFPTEPPSARAIGLTLTLGGLQGGHSGVDIHLERGNAIKLLTRVLAALAPLGLQLAKLQGGTARNALPRDAEAWVACPADREAEWRATLSALQAQLREELAGTDEGLTLTLSPPGPPPESVLPPGAQRQLLGVLLSAPHGVRRWSRRVPGVVETSNNLGLVSLESGPAGASFSAHFMVRSLVATGSTELADQIVALFSLIGAHAELSGAYPGWAPRPASPLLAWFQRLHAQEFGAPAEVAVSHAGLECGILASKFPGLDVVSFGPDIRGAHAPGERVHVASVDAAWRLLATLLAELPAGGPAAQP